jgi:choline dehydrogenase-like flavoprotein
VSRLSRECGILNVSRSYSPPRPVTGIAFIFTKDLWRQLLFHTDRRLIYDLHFADTGMKHQRCNWPRGKVIGGSSVLNYMLYVRGNKKDYDIWESLGNPGWGSEEALYYFKKSEDNRNPYLARTPYHSTGGYLTVQEAPWHTPLAAAFVQAGVEMGYVFTITSTRHTKWRRRHRHIKTRSRLGTLRS